MLSGELATFLLGKYIEIKMLPLSFKEYNELMKENVKENFNKFFVNGGFPYTTNLGDDELLGDYKVFIIQLLLKIFLQERK